MLNFDLLTAEICWQVWGTPANFNGFRILAVLLHSTLVVGVSQTLQGWTEGAAYGRAAITLGIGPHSSSTSKFVVIDIKGLWQQLTSQLTNMKRDKV